MNTSSSPQTRQPIERVKHWLVGWWNTTPVSVLPPDPEQVPTVEQALEQDGPLRWRILVILDRADGVSLKFIEVMTHRAFFEKRQRSLAWLLATDCIMEHRYRHREVFWQPWREVITYAITPIGEALFARINETATAEQLGIQPGATDPLRNLQRRWFRVVHVAFFLALVALSLAIEVPLLMAICTR